MSTYTPSDSKISLEKEISPIITFKIFVEGQKSEKNYFSDFEKFIVNELSGNEFIEIEPIPRDSGARNSTLIAKAEIQYNSEISSSSSDDEKLSEEDESENDLSKIWILFDIEGDNCTKSENDLALLELQKLQSRNSHIKVALSNPSFEYWVLLHLIDSSNKCKLVYTDDKADKLCDYKNGKSMMGVFKHFKGTPFHNYKKNFNFEESKIFEDKKHIPATKLSKEIKKFHQKNSANPKSFSKDELYKNRPFTDVDELMEELLEAVKQVSPYIQIKEKTK